MSALVDEPWAIPSGWIWTTAGEVTDVVGGGTPRSGDSANFDNGTIPWITPADLSGYTAKYIAHGSRSLTEKGLDDSAARLLPTGSVLFSSRAPIGYVAIAANPLATNQGFKSLVPPSQIDPEFLYYYLQRAKGLAVSLASGTTFLEISGAKTARLPLIVAPLPEQQRIVEAIESYFTRLDDAVATLERVQRNLKQYRAALLKAAVEGRLVPTEAELARAEGRDYEPASVLLQRIVVERRRRWQEAGGRGKYEEPEAPDTSDVSELPEGWCWATLDALADLKGGITKGQKRSPSDVLREVPYLRVANVQRGRLDLSVVKRILATEAEIDELRLHPGDVLFNEGGDRDKLGRGWVWNGEVPECIHQNHVFRARILTADLHPKFMSWYGNTAGQRYFFEEGKQTTNLASINLTKLRALPVPIPPLVEQTRIVEEAERLLSLADEAELVVTVGTRRGARLRQAILKWAFEGRLADQDPNDEPASVLLERIRDETSARPASAPTDARPKRRGRKSKMNSSKSRK